jgi:uncharacterized membrane protein
MKRLLRALSAAGAGAALAYLLDPDRGRRRRAVARDKLASVAARGPQALDVLARDARNRATGVVAELRSALKRGPVSDEELAARIRSRVSFLSSHPGAIDVRVLDGQVTLSGFVLAAEADRVVARVARMSGVRGVDNRLSVHEQPGEVPALQGQPARPRGGQVIRMVWSPTGRVLAGTLGTGLALGGLRLGGLPGIGVLLGGLTLLARAATNLPLRRLTGVGAGRHALDVQKSITIAAPVERVFAFWDRYENFPRVMSWVREVRDLGGGRSRWVVAGPGGAPITWDAEVTTRIPNEVIAWRTLPGATVAHEGVVRFDPTDGGTRMSVRLTYNPPGGAVSGGFATLVGADPQRILDEDLIRVKSLLEEGRDRIRAGDVTGERS